MPRKWVSIIVFLHYNSCKTPQKYFTIFFHYVLKPGRFS